MLEDQSGIAAAIASMPSRMRRGERQDDSQEAVAEEALSTEELVAADQIAKSLEIVCGRPRPGSAPAPDRRHRVRGGAVDGAELGLDTLELEKGVAG